MPTRTAGHFVPDPAAVLRPGPRGLPGRASVRGPASPTTRPGVRDRSPDGPAAPQAPRGHALWNALGMVARVGLALLLTAGFAVALNLYADRSALEPAAQQACAWVFGWCLAVLGLGGRE